jgi:predicted RNase H-like HicB family nuclease
MSRRQGIEIELDPETNDYFIIWEPRVISLGKTEKEALEDLREAAHFAVDILVDLKHKDIERGAIRDE